MSFKRLLHVDFTPHASRLRRETLLQRWLPLIPSPPAGRGGFGVRQKPGGVERELLPRSQPQAGNPYWKALPCLTAALPLQGHFQVEPPKRDFRRVLG
ncbi:hypothetical protein [Scytonema sp. PCC 10023]|uniref:hypothetical protein n=1 Tax=Scytonema sp. PCC 10023 TaxID=1680591 RepID=UPI0039C61941